MSLLDDMVRELEAAFPALGAGEARRVLDPYHARLNRLVPGAIENIQEESGAPSFARPDFTLGSPYTELALDLDDASLNSSQGVGMNLSGYGLYFRRQGSSPITRLTITSSGQITDFYPGSRLEIPFKFLNIRATKGKTTVPYSDTNGGGQARLLVFNQPNVRYEEPQTNIAGLAFPPVLLGTVNNWVVGTLLNYTALINTQGWNTVRAYVTCNGGTQANAFDVKPMVASVSAPTLAYEMSSRGFTVPDSNPTANRSRTWDFNCQGVDLLGFGVANPQPSAGAFTTYSYTLWGTS